ANVSTTYPAPFRNLLSALRTAGSSSTSATVFCSFSIRGDLRAASERILGRVSAAMNEFGFIRAGASDVVMRSGHEVARSSHAHGCAQTERGPALVGESAP